MFIWKINLIGVLLCFDLLDYKPNFSASVKKACGHIIEERDVLVNAINKALDGIGPDRSEQYEIFAQEVLKNYDLTR